MSCPMKMDHVEFRTRDNSKNESTDSFRLAPKLARSNSKKLVEDELVEDLSKNGEGV